MSSDFHPFDAPADSSLAQTPGLPQPSAHPRLALLARVLTWALGIVVALAAAGAIAIALILATAYPNLPDISDLADYRPKLPLRVYTADNVLIGEFGEERRNLMPIGEIPKVMKDALLAIEDARFYQHGGVDYVGIVRAALANLGRERSQGASTISMQVARNVYLSSEKTYTRKIYEILLTLKLEHLLTKDQILEIYMNQIYLGNRAYGFAAASETYFGKPLAQVSVAEAAMLAGLAKFPSTGNPIVNPKRARIRQLYIIDRMVENNFITPQQADAARNEQLVIRSANDLLPRSHAEYVAETVRQLLYAQYGEETYTRGMNVYTTLRADHQNAAYSALRKGLLDFDRRQAWRGPEKYVDLDHADKSVEDVIDDTLAEFPDQGELQAAVVTAVGAKKLTVVRSGGETLEISGDGLRAVGNALSEKANPQTRIRRGAVVRIVQNKDTWAVTQAPEVEGAFVSIDPRDGAILALVGGFDFRKNKFNHVTQAWRQPGSSFKPFIYSAALEKGFTGATVINDAPLFYDATTTGSQVWEPKNYDGRFEGPMSMRRALAKSKNMVSIRILEAITPQYAQDWVARFGFDAEKHPPYLTMALGAGSVTPMQMATAYSVFANGGYRVNPYLITRITDPRGKTLVDFQPKPSDESLRAVDARNAFVMSSLLGEVTRSGTAARAQSTLKRNDLYGKTGTTNDSMDAWFAGYQPTLAAVVWIGYDTPRKLGDRETGGGLSLPVWISYMQTALQGVPIKNLPVPEGVTSSGGEWFYEEYARGNGVTGLGLDDPLPITESVDSAPTAADERSRILDIFRH